MHVWLDERDYGTHDTLCTPQVVEFGEGLKAGKHRLTIRVDNTAKFDLGTHISSWSEHTQTNWNGMIGRLELRASDPIAIESMQIYPDVAHKMASVRLNLSNFSGRPATATIELSVTEKERLAGIPLMLLDYEIPVGGKWLEADVPMGERIKPWDEFSPALYTMMAKLEARVENRSYADQRSEQFGMRQLGIDDGRQFTMNGRRIFLRGTVECCVFPQTGYPSMDLKNWAWIFSICRSHGLNHMRFHSWCPPEAAFAAADEAGMMLQVEGPQANVLQGKDPSYDRFIAEEIHGILAAYGNHPSFCFLAMGNEVAGSVESLEKLLDYCIKTDPRHLYASHSNDWTIAPVTNRQYLVTPRIRGVKGEDTDHDFRSQVGKHPCPQVSHEVGQWAVFPRMAEIGKYTGVRRARNFELIREQLRANGILDQAEDFTQASGHLSALLYKEEVESLLRTPGHAGFQLLQLNDYPGQGTALVGMLDPFWDSKGFITPEQFHCFCGPTVPLARLKKRVFTSDETLSAKVEVAHFGPATLENAQPAWSLKDDQGRAIASGRWTPRTIPTGALSPLGAIDVDLSKVSAPARLKLSVTLEGTSAANDWQIWVYPALPVPSAPADIYVSRAWDGTTTAALAAGRKVLLLPPQTAFAPGKSLAGKFLPVFWSPVFFNLFKKGPMGMLCDPQASRLGCFSHRRLRGLAVARLAGSQRFGEFGGHRQLAPDRPGDRRFFQQPQAKQPIRGAGRQRPTAGLHDRRVRKTRPSPRHAATPAQSLCVHGVRAFPPDATAGAWRDFQAFSKEMNARTIAELAFFSPGLFVQPLGLRRPLADKYATLPVSLISYSPWR